MLHLLLIQFTLANISSFANADEKDSNPPLTHLSVISFKDSKQKYIVSRITGSGEIQITPAIEKNGTAHPQKNNIPPLKLSYVGYPHEAQSFALTKRKEDINYERVPYLKNKKQEIVFADGSYLYYTNPELKSVIKWARPAGEIQKLTFRVEEKYILISIKTLPTVGEKISQTGTFVVDLTEKDNYYDPSVKPVFEVKADKIHNDYIEQLTAQYMDTKKTSLRFESPQLTQALFTTLLHTSPLKFHSEVQQKSLREIDISKPAEREELRKKLFAQFQKDTTTFASIVDGYLVGQVEARDILLDIFHSNFKNDYKRTVPEIFMLIGKPGTGKDTAAEAFVIANTTIRYGQEAATRALDEHLYRQPVVRDEMDIKSAQGSGTGYVGSDKVSDLIRWVVKHSGGRYKIETTEGLRPEEKVVENPAWQPGQVLEGYFAPEDGLLFLNEFHDWSKKGKNVIAKEIIEKGIFSIGNPAGGLRTIQVPVTVLIASNDGIRKIQALDRYGNIVGEPLTYQQELGRWDLAHRDKVALKQEISLPTPSNIEGGMSPEMASRIPNSRLALLKPLSPEELTQITHNKLNFVSKTWASNKDYGFPSLKINWDPSLPKAIVDFRPTDLSGPRELNDKIDGMVWRVLTKNILTGRLNVENNQTLNLKIEANKDNTVSLVVNGQRLFIDYSFPFKFRKKISDQEITKAKTLDTQLNAEVQGLQHITKKMAEDIRISMNMPTDRPAEIYAFFGLSSTGKSQLGFSLNQILNKTNDKPLSFDFGRIYSKSQVEQLILGSRDANNRPIPSTFMEHFDRNNGELIVMLDEFTNAPVEVQHAIYDLLREGTVTTFSDGKARKMGRVRFIITGNLGEEWYRNIPRDAPEIQQWKIAQQIYEKAITDSGFLRGFLLSKLTEAALNRIGMNRIYFFGPHTPNTIREMIQSKLVKLVEKVRKPQPEMRTWDISFLRKSDYLQTIEAIENHGFNLWEQGASITRFIETDFAKALNLTLLDNQVPDRAQVSLVKLPDDITEDKASIKWSILVEGRKDPLIFSLPGKPKVKAIKSHPLNFILTAYHEAGHEVIRHILKGDRTKSKGISIIPGIANINGQMILYEGVAIHEKTLKVPLFFEQVIAEIAGLSAGYVAESLVVKGQKKSAGGSNDIQRATQLAQRAVLELGLTEFGTRALQPNQSVEQYLISLSENERVRFSEQVHKLLKMGEQTARDLLIANFDRLVMPLATHLAEKGKLSGEAIERFYVTQRPYIVYGDEFTKIQTLKSDFENRLKEPLTSRRSDIELFSYVKRPRFQVDIEELQAKEFKEARAKVDLSPGDKILAQAQTLSKLRSGIVVNNYKVEGLAAILAAARSLNSQATGTCQALLAN